VSARAFGWDRALTATLRHVSLPWDEPLAATPLAELTDPGARDRLSLLAQFAAHQALLQFAGVADGEFDAAEWAVVQKRGQDVRLVRIASRPCDASVAPPVLTIAQQFAERAGAAADVLRQTWARADAIYADVFARLSRDAAADLRWVRRSAYGAIAAPGPEGLRTLLSDGGRHSCEESACVDAVKRFAELDGTFEVAIIRGASPIERYSALGALARDRGASPAATAERILASTSRAPHLFIVRDDDAMDEASREVVQLLSNGGHGAWLMPSGENALPATREFIVAPHLAARNALSIPFESLVASDAFASYLAHGDVPAAPAVLPLLREPLRSYIGALALLGTSIPRTLATLFLADFLFHGPLDDLAVEGVLSVGEQCLTFAGEEIRNEASRSIPEGSRAAICRVAASHASGVRAALLWLDGGDPEQAAAALEKATWASSREAVDELRRVPPVVLTPAVAARYGYALVDCGRYREARDVTTDELVLARGERRSGDYATALARLERIGESFDSMLLRAEVLRLMERDDEALAILARCTPQVEEDRIRLDYERALHGTPVELPPAHYLSARLETYRALDAGQCDDAARIAEEAHRRAANATERIDASLDRLFATFSAGRWDDARVIAVEALQETEETQGDRAAGGILFTLAYLAADAGQWSHATHRIARLRQFYTATRDRVRLAELHLLSAHLDFSRGRFGDARRAAEAIYARRGHHDQISEAAALILDELDWSEGIDAPLRSTGRSGNEELRRRHLRIASRDASCDTSGSIPERLFAFRRAVAARDDETARRVAVELDLVFDPAPAPAEVELRLLRAAATREYPFAPQDFDVPWCFATRNRLGQWNAIGSVDVSGDVLASSLGEPDWIECSDRERLYVQGCSQWSPHGREAAAAIVRIRAENHRFHRLLAQEESVASRAHAIDGIVGRSAAILEVENVVTRVARRDVAVCILGESGTGKELVARAIHRQSQRRQKPFTALNCAVLPENLVESELFGHVRGAFTGADRDRAGLIETSDGGTLFLDEIGELPLVAQAKLLRFLQEGEFRRVGDTVNRSADVRIVSATNRTLESAVEEGRFRDDLYYRVRGVEVTLPPLRQRGADILLLASHFLAVERDKHRAGPAVLSADVEAIFNAYGWPGNVRELQNTIRAAHAMAGEAREIDVEHLPERLRKVAPARAAAGSYQHAVARFKRDLIESSLVQAKGNQNRAAAMLKMSRQALAYQIRELGIMIRAGS